MTGRILDQWDFTVAGAYEVQELTLGFKRKLDYFDYLDKPSATFLSLLKLENSIQYIFDVYYTAMSK